MTRASTFRSGTDEESPAGRTEIALAVKAGKTVVLLGGTEIAERFFQDLSSENIIATQSAEEAIPIIKSRLHI